tara:strand:+ start:329 stop:574 length:246 start_codon:yes stop_codon:yes gene_type:complete
MTTDYERRKQIKKAVDSVLKNGRSKKVVMAEFTKAKAVDYPVEQELFNRVLKLVHEYDGDISFASCIGVLDLAKNELLNAE